jgi:hypothetical protein
VSNVIVPDVAKIQHMKNALNIASTHYPDKLKLFKNSATLSHATVLSDLTEADFSGYSAYSLAGGAVAGALDGSGRAVASYTAHTFTKSGATGNTIYGYWVEDSTGALLWCELFDTPIPMTVDGAFIQITPKFTDASQFSNT